MIFTRKSLQLPEQLYLDDPYLDAFVAISDNGPLYDGMKAILMTGDSVDGNIIYIKFYLTSGMVLLEHMIRFSVVQSIKAYSRE